MYCPHCHTLLADDAVRCPACGQPVAVPAEASDPLSNLFAGVAEADAELGDPGPSGPSRAGNPGPSGPSRAGDPGPSGPSRAGDGPSRAGEPHEREPTSINVRLWEQQGPHVSEREPPPPPGQAGIATQANLMPGAAGVAPDGEAGIAPHGQVATGSASDQRGVHTRIVPVDALGGQTKLVEVNLSSAAKRGIRELEQPARADQEGVPESLIEQFAQSARHLFSRMHRLDRWTVLVAAFGLVTVFLPWQKVVGQGLVAGVETIGGLSAVAALFALGFVYWRTERRRLGIVLIFGQLISGAGIVATPVYLWINRVDANFAFGSYCTVLAGVLLLLLTLARAARLST